MNIKNFKEDDIITRSEPASFNGDRSYMGDKMSYVGTEAGMIVLIQLDSFQEGEIIKLRTDSFSDGWSYYPQTLIDKAITKIKEIIKK